MSKEDEYTVSEMIETAWRSLTSWIRTKKRLIKQNLHDNDISEHLNEINEDLKQVRERIVFNGSRPRGEVVEVRNGVVTVNGKRLSIPEKEITIEIHGNVERFSADECAMITITGNAGSVETMSGSVSCNDVAGDVSTMSGSVNCGTVSGSVETMSGNIRKK